MLIFKNFLFLNFKAETFNTLFYIIYSFKSLEVDSNNKLNKNWEKSTVSTCNSNTRLHLVELLYLSEMHLPQGKNICHFYTYITNILYFIAIVSYNCHNFL